MLSNYFQGRTNRRDYALLFTPMLIPLITISAFIVSLMPEGMKLASFVLIQVTFNALLSPLIIRRMHDIGYSGWLLLIAVPFIVLSWFFYLGLIFYKGQDNPNKWGDVPKNAKPLFRAYLYADNDLNKTESEYIKEIEKVSLKEAKEKEENSPDKQYLKNLLIALLPAMFVFLALTQIGLRGALVPLFTYFGGAYLVGVFRKKHQHYSKKKMLTVYLILLALSFLLSISSFYLAEV